MGSPPLGLPAVVERRKEHRVTGAGARTESRSLETMVPTPQEAARAIGARRRSMPGMQGRRHKHGDVPSRASERCAMTSRTNRHSPERNQRGETRTVPSALPRRRQEALERYLAGDPIAVICREMGCAKSWLYKPTVCPSMIPLGYCHINSCQRASSVVRPSQGGEKKTAVWALHPEER